MWRGADLLFVSLVICVCPVRSVPLYGGISDLGYYFLDISVGTPPQRMSVILDTGSEGIAFTCTGCLDNCGNQHMDPFFNPSVSSTLEHPPECQTSLRNSECVFQKRYLEGSALHGKYLMDLVAVDAGILGKATRFGCIESETKLFLDQKANGIFGLAPLPRTYWLDDEVAAFSICLAERGGSLEFHSVGVDTLPNLVSKNRVLLQYIEGHYVVTPSHVSVGDQRSSGDIASVLGSEVLIDSGSTHTYLAAPLFDRVLREIEGKIAQNWATQLEKNDSGPTICWRIREGGTSVNLASLSSLLPVITLSFETIDGASPVHVRFENYMYSLNGQQCLTIASNGRLDRTDLGASWMMGKSVTFSKSDGWVHIQDPGNCVGQPLESRLPVQPVPGQLDTDPSPPRAFGAMIAVLALIMVCLAIIVKRSVVPDPEYTRHITSPAEQVE